MATKPKLIPPLEEDLQNAILAFLPDIPQTHAQQLYLRRLVGSLAVYPEDWESGKELQNRGLPVNFECNAEMAAGMWHNKIRPKLLQAFRECFVGPCAPHKGSRGIGESRYPHRSGATCEFCVASKGPGGRVNLASTYHTINFPPDFIAVACCVVCANKGAEWMMKFSKDIRPGRAAGNG